jgi:hypothetical protein
LLTGKNGNQSYLAFRYLFVLTNGKSNDIVSKIISTFVSPYPLEKDSSDILSALSESEVEVVVDNLNTNGFHLFSQKLAPDTISKLVEFASETPVLYLKFDEKHITYSNEEVPFGEPNLFHLGFNLKIRN